MSNAVSNRARPQTRTGGWQPAIGWLGCGQRSGAILATVQRLAQVQHAVRQALPGVMGANCQVLLFDDHSVTLAVPGAVYAAKLRQMTPAICRQLNRKGWAVTDVHIKIVMPTENTQTAARRGAPLGAQGLRAFAQLAADLPPGPVADAVQRLLRHHGRASP